MTEINQKTELELIADGKRGDNCRALTELFDRHYPQRLRLAIFMLCAVSEFTVSEAAAVLGLTRAAAKTRLYRAHVRMRARLKSLWRPEGRVAA